MEESDICQLCADIKGLSYLDEHKPNEEFIFSYKIPKYGRVYKHFLDDSYRDILCCPKCGRRLRYL